MNDYKQSNVNPTAFAQLAPNALNSVFFTNLEDYTTTVFDQEQKLAGLRNELRDAERRLDDARTTCEESVYSATTDAGKPMYGNAESRKAAVARALAEHYKGEQRAVDSLRNDIALAEVVRDDASRRRQNALAIMAHQTSLNYLNQPIPRG